jgi:hypothetical protein
MTTPMLPAYLQNSNLPDFTDRLGQNLGSGSPPYVSIMGNRFTLFDSSGDSEPVTTVDPKTGVPYLDCVIIDFNEHLSKIHYGQAFDPNATSYSPPKCWSDNGIGPSINCSEPQARSCTPDPEGLHGCKLAVWGSAVSKVSGKGIPACGAYQKLALLIPGDEVEFLLRVPPNSLDNLRTYNAKFKGQPISMRDVVTRLSFEQGGIGTLTFAGLNYIDEATTKQRNEALMAKKTDALVGRGDKPRQAVLAAPAEAPLSLGAPPAHIASSPVSAPAAPPQGIETSPAATPTRRRRKSAEAAVPETAPPANQGSNGIVQGTAPNADLEASLKSLFG